MLRRLRVSRHLVHNSFVMFGANAGAGLIQYIVVILMARTLGPAGLGAVVLATTVSSLTAAAVELGIGQVLVRYRQSLADSAPEVWAALVRGMLRLSSLVGTLILCVAALAGLALALDPSLGKGVRAVAFGAAIAAPTVLWTFGLTYLQAQVRFRLIGSIALGAAVLRLALIAVLWLADALTPDSALTVYVISTVVPAAITLYVSVGREWPMRVGDQARAKARELARPFLRWTAAGRASAALSGRVDVLLLSALSGSVATGIYGAALQSAAPLSMVATAVGEVSFPHLARKGGPGRNREVIGGWAVWLPIFTICGILAALVGVVLLPVLLGPKFDRAAAAMAILMITYGIQIWLQPLGSLLYATDRQKECAMITLGTAVGMIVFDLILIPQVGALGPPIGMLVTTLIAGPITIVAAIRPKRSDGHPVAVEGAQTAVSVTPR